MRVCESGNEDVKDIMRAMSSKEESNGGRLWLGSGAAVREML